ncbi:hypothetical protein AADZ90_005055 [Aestuariibius sp. 2305UL40-4]
MRRKIGTAPLVDRSMTDLTEKEFTFVSGTRAIRPAYDAFIDRKIFIKETWDKMLAGASRPYGGGRASTDFQDVRWHPCRRTDRFDLS